MSNAPAAPGEAVMPLAPQDVEAMRVALARAGEVMLPPPHAAETWCDCPWCLRERALASPVAPAETAPTFTLYARVLALLDRCAAGTRDNWRDTSPSYWVGVAEGEASAYATEAALRAKVERLARENEHFSATNRGLVNDLEAAESREAALRGERDEARSAFAAMSEQWTALTTTAHERAEALGAAEKERDEACEALLRLAAWVESSLLMGADPAKRVLRQEAAVARSVLARIRKGTPDHE